MGHSPLLLALLVNLFGYENLKGEVKDLSVVHGSQDHAHVSVMVAVCKGQGYFRRRSPSIGNVDTPGCWVCMWREWGGVH